MTKEQEEAAMQAVLDRAKGNPKDFVLSRVGHINGLVITDVLTVEVWNSASDDVWDVWELLSGR